MYKNEDILSIENIQQKYFFVTWKITGWCNYHCPYCINAASREVFTRWKPESEVIEAAKKINKLIKETNTNQLPVKLKLIGGEVCFYHLLSVVAEIENISKLLVTSNFSRDLNYYKELISYCSLNKIDLLLMLSYHEENTDFMNKAIELTNWCWNKNFQTPQLTFVISSQFNFNLLDQCLANNIKRVKLIYEKDDLGRLITLDKPILDKCSSYAKQFCQEGFAKTYKITFLDGSIEYFSNIYQFINELDGGGFMPSGWLCDASNNKITISYDDKIYLNKCNFLKDICLGTLDDHSPYVPNLVKCDLSNEQVNICNLCSSISAWRELN